MTKVKFIHTSDLHLDTPFKSLSNWNPELANRLKDATFKSFSRIIELSISEKVDFLIIAGDVFDSEQHSLTAQIRFLSELKKLTNKNIPVYIVCGNHDPYDSWMSTLHLPENIHRFVADKFENFIFEKDGHAIANICGISFKEKVNTENLAKKFPEADKNIPVSIAVLHGTIGTHGSHEVYAPFKKSDIESKNYDYWALGHIHKKEIIHTSFPAIVYPGNPQGRDFGEQGQKGCFMVELESGHEPVLKFFPVQEIIFHEIKLNINGIQTINELFEMFDKNLPEITSNNTGNGFIIRIKLTGNTVLHSQLINNSDIENFRDHLNNMYAGQFDKLLFIDRIITETKPDIDIEKLKKGSGFIAELLQSFESYENDHTGLINLINKEVNEISNPLIKNLFNDLTQSERTEILEKAKWLLTDFFNKDKYDN